MRGKLPVTHFNYDHRERKNIAFHAVRPPFLQDLWRSPSQGVSWYGIRVLSEVGKSKIPKARAAGVVHEDVSLCKCKRDDKTRFRMTTYPLEVSVNHTAGVEVMEALSSVRQLAMGVSVRRAQWWDYARAHVGLHQGFPGCTQASLHRASKLKRAGRERK